MDPERTGTRGESEKRGEAGWDAASAGNPARVARRPDPVCDQLRRLYADVLDAAADQIAFRAVFKQFYRGSGDDSARGGARGDGGGFKEFRPPLGAKISRSDSGVLRGNDT